MRIRSGFFGPLFVVILLALGGVMSCSEEVDLAQKQREEAKARAAAGNARRAEEERRRRQAEDEAAQQTPKGHEMFALLMCPDEVEKLANYGVRWVDGWLEPKLSRHGWRDEEAGIAVYMGDRVEFQNAFGAWQPHIYACFVDVRRSAVVNVTERPGRLP